MSSNREIADVLIIGAGASGGAFAWSLSQSGIKVVCLEQGGWVPTNAFPADRHDSQLQWQHEFHPNPNVRQLPEDYPVNEDATPIAPLMYNAVGGSMIHWGSHFPRFHPSDFRAYTLDGVGEDWPLDYFELEPYYDLNDKMHGVSGLQGDPAYPPKPARPTTPLSIRKSGAVLARGFNKLGWHWWSSDSAICSVPYEDFPVDCGKVLRSLSSADIIYWPRALKNGAVLRTHCRVREVLVDKSGRVTGALYYDPQGNLQFQGAKVVVMAANGVGTTRLLLNSRSPLFPDGLANSSGLVGKYLTHHPVSMAMGFFEEDFGCDNGPRGSAMLSQEFFETNPKNGFVRGYELQVLGGALPPLGAALGGLMGQPVAWGPRHHEEFHERFCHAIAISCMTEDLPEEHNRVTLDDKLTDSHGIPAARIEYTISENTWKQLDHGVARAKEALEAAGARQVISVRQRRNAGWHLLGTCRMGNNPSTSVVDRWGRAHDVPNLFVIDGGVFTTASCVNPTSTIEALALRTADYLKGEGRWIVG